MTTSTAWRARMCPSCRTFMRAGSLINKTMGANWNTEGYAERECPRCGYTGETRDFPVVHPYWMLPAPTVQTIDERMAALGRPPQDRPSRGPSPAHCICCGSTKSLTDLRARDGNTIPACPPHVADAEHWYVRWLEHWEYKDKQSVFAMRPVVRP